MKIYVPSILSLSSSPISKQYKKLKTLTSTIPFHLHVTQNFCLPFCPPKLFILVNISRFTEVLRRHFLLLSGLY